ncbi:hypothetical protein C8R46DRAFT_1215206 [Mycena filopes]|nr:hypothetical protein C8R46DRAFT_1235358 [Mycena filopes]KAJ7141980.1 hypothetical protein C8R46DRAFT_1233410 [Mycena filopes]KAJ7173249.1 hypothetical protein C8R46DRAFT_1215206 [Mycena filopes]
MGSSPSHKKLNQAQFDAVLALGESVRATRYDSRDKQRSFLDEKTTALEAFLPYIAHIASDKVLYDVAYGIKNSYHQTAVGPSGVIAGRYPVIMDFISRIKTERDRIKNAALLGQQVHRAELDEARNPSAETLAAELQATKEAAQSSKTSKKTKSKKKVKSRPTVEDGDESPFDDTDFPVEGNGEVDDPMIIDGPNPALTPAPEPTPARYTQSLDERALTSSSKDSKRASSAMNILRRTDPEVEQQVVAEEFSPPSTRKRAKRSHAHAHEDSEEQIAAAELATNSSTIVLVLSDFKKPNSGVESPSLTLNSDTNSTIANTSSKTSNESWRRNTNGPKEREHSNLRHKAIYESQNRVIYDAGAQVSVPFCHYCGTVPHRPARFSPGF